MSKPLAVAVLVACLAACSGRPEVVDLVAAASLGPVLEPLIADYMQQHPGVQIRLQTGGSAALVRRVLELDLKADILVLADSELFIGLERRFSAPQPWVTDRLVLALRPGLEPDPGKRWTEYLGAAAVRIGMADPDTAPLGYRTLMALRLQDAASDSDLEAQVRRRVGRRGLRPDAASLLAPLQSGDLDMAFLYASSARAASLNLVELPARVHLGDADLAAAYAKVSVETAGETPGQRVRRIGAPIVYGLAARAGAGPAVRQLVQQLLGPGRDRLQRMGYGRPSVSE